MSDLLPCPFCGPQSAKEENDEVNRVAIYAATERDGYVRGWTVTCDRCGIEVSDEYEDEAVAAWNTRNGVRPDSPAL